MRLTIPDDLADRLLLALPTTGTNHQQKHANATAGPEHTVDELACRILTRGLPLADAGAVVLTKKQAAALAGALQLPEGATDPARLIVAAEALADLRVGKLKLTLPPPVLRGLKSRADREGIPLGAYLQQAIDKLTEDLGVYA